MGREKRDPNNERVGEGGIWPFTIKECAMKLTPKTSSIVHMSAVMRIIHNNSQEAAAIAITLNLEPDYPNSIPSSVS